MQDQEKQGFAGTERFKLVRKLGAGGFGVVYQANDQERNTVVALKVLHQQEGKDLYYFKQEFRSLADISHPNLITLYELLSAEDYWFFTMEMIEGKDFLSHVQNISRIESTTNATLSLEIPKVLNNSEVEKREQIPAESRPTKLFADPIRLRLALKQLAKGLYALHKSGKLHRDIKPSNVLVTRDDRVVILDFGLVAEILPHVKKDFSPELAIVGTPAYMSPEQSVGESLTAASDWYSVGVILYEALTGKLPFAGSLDEMIREKQLYDPPPPSELVKDVPDELNKICMELLRRKPTERLSGLELLRRLGSKGTNSLLGITLGLTPFSPKQNYLFLGRERELADLHQSFVQAQNGQATIVYLHGSSGMGKSMLVRQFLDQIYAEEPELVMLMGRCYNQESVPYKAFDSIIDDLSKYLKGLSDVEVVALLPRYIQALALLFPVLKQVDAIAQIPYQGNETSDPQELRRRAFTALRELLARLTENHPVVLFIDDLQWGDVDSVALLRELFRRPDPPPLLLLATYRSEEVETSPMLRALLAHGETNSMGANIRKKTVNKLSVEAAQELAAGLICKYHQDKLDVIEVEQLAEKIAREADGHPYFIDGMARYLPQDSNNNQAISDVKNSDTTKNQVMTLAEIILRRAEQLPEPVRQLLEIVAVAGKPIKVKLAEKAANFDPQEQTGLTMLEKGHLVRLRETTSGDELEPYHDQIREAIVASLSPVRQKACHQSLALVLETDNQSDAEQLMVHFQGAEDLPKAAQYALTAADQAFTALAFDHAAQLYQFALDFQTTKDANRYNLQIKLAESLTKAGRGAKAAQIYLVCAETAAEIEAVELQRRAAEQLLISGHIDEGMKVVRIVLDKIGMKLATTPRNALISLLFNRLQIKLRGLKFKERDSSQIPAAELTRIDTCWSISTGLSTVNTTYGADFQSRHLLLALKTGEPNRVARALATEVAYNSLAGGKSHQRTQQLIEATRSLVERLNNPALTGLAKLMEGIAAWAEGRWRQAYLWCAEAEKILRENLVGGAWDRDTAHLFMLYSLIPLGELKLLAQRLPSLLTEAQEHGDLYGEINLRLRGSRYFLYLAEDEVDKAEQEVEIAIQKWSNQRFYMQHFYAFVARMEIALYRQQEISEKQLETEWLEVKNSLFLRLQTLRIEALFLHARSLLATATKAAEPNPLLTAAARDAKLIEREKMAWGNPIAQLIRASIAAQQDHIQEAIKLLTAAEIGFEAVDMVLYAAATRRCRGQLIGGSQGGELIKSADLSMTNQNIKNTVNMTILLAPGRWGA